MFKSIETEYDLTAQVNNIIHKFEPHLAKKDLEIAFIQTKSTMFMQIKNA